MFRYILNPYMPKGELRPHTTRYLIHTCKKCNYGHILLDTVYPWQEVEVECLLNFPPFYSSHETLLTIKGSVVKQYKQLVATQKSGHASLCDRWSDFAAFSYLSCWYRR